MARLSLVALLQIGLRATAMAVPESILPVDVTLRTTAMYASGSVMAEIMSIKEGRWGDMRNAGRFNSSRYEAPIDNPVPCLDGKAVLKAGDAMQSFRCNNVGSLLFWCLPFHKRYPRAHSWRFGDYLEIWGSSAWNSVQLYSGLLLTVRVPPVD